MIAYLNDSMKYSTLTPFHQLLIFRLNHALVEPRLILKRNFHFKKMFIEPIETADSINMVNLAPELENKLKLSTS